MLKKFFFGVGVFAFVIGVWGGAWYFRPWSDYSPAKVINSRGETDRAPIYRAMEEYFPYREIVASPNPITLPRDLRAFEIEYSFDGASRTLDDYAADYAITGLMIVKDGHVVLERYWQGETSDDRHASWSVAKSFIATLIGVGIKEGKIKSIDDRVDAYASIYADSDYGSITIRDLLTMSAGIDFEEDYDVPGSDIRELFFNTFILNRDIDRSVRKYRRDREPGGEFDYISTNSAVLGAIVSAAYDGATLSALASEKIFAPAGMEAGTWLLDRNNQNGKELAYCCINIRLEDYAKFGLLYLYDGVAGGQRVLPEGWASFVGTPPRDTHMADLLAQGRQYGYGHHFWVPANDTGAFFAAGYNGQFVWIDPVANVVLAMTSADLTYPEHNKEAHFLHKAAVAAAAALPQSELGR